MNSASNLSSTGRQVEGPTSMSQTDLLSRCLAQEARAKVRLAESSMGSLKWDSRSNNMKVYTARSGMDSSMTVLNSGTIKKLTRKATVNASPEHQIQVRSRSKSRADFESAASGLAKSIEQKVLDRKVKEISKDWMEERQAMKKQIKRLEFMVRQWELIDHQTQSKPKGTVETLPTSANQQVSEPPGKPTAESVNSQKEELQRVRAQLRQTQNERDEVLKDMREMQQELKKIRWMPGQTPRFYRQENFHQSSHQNLSMAMMDGAKSTRNSQQRYPIGKPPKPRLAEVQHVHEHYNRIIAQKDYDLELQQMNLNSLQEQLEQQRHDTVTLLERRTCELNKQIETLKQSYEENSEDLRLQIDRLNMEIGQEKVKANTYQCQLNLKSQLVQYLEGQILSLSQSMRKKEQKEQKQQPQVSSLEAFKLVDTSFGAKPRATTQSMTSQTESSYLWTADEGTQVSLINMERVSSFKNLHGEIDKLSKRSVQLNQQIVEKDMLISELTATSPRTNDESTKQLQRICSQLVQQNARLKTLILEGVAHDDKAIEQTRIRIITKEINKCDLNTINNPYLIKELTELRLFRTAASKELQRLKNDLVESRITSEIGYEDKQLLRKSQVSKEDRILRNSYEMAISNLNSQMNGLRTKLQGLQLRYDIKCRELKEKDLFVRNVIVSRVGREATTSDLQYFNRKLDEFMTVTSPRSSGRNNRTEG